MYMYIYIRRHFVSREPPSGHSTVHHRSQVTMSISETPVSCVGIAYKMSKSTHIVINVNASGSLISGMFTKANYFGKNRFWSGWTGTAEFVTPDKIMVHIDSMRRGWWYGCDEVIKTRFCYLRFFDIGSHLPELHNIEQWPVTLTIQPYVHPDQRRQNAPMLNTFMIEHLA